VITTSVNLNSGWGEETPDDSSFISVRLVWLQVESMTERVEELKQDKKRLVEEYEAKLSKVLWPTPPLGCRYHYEVV